MNSFYDANEADLNNLTDICSFCHMKNPTLSIFQKIKIFLCEQPNYLNVQMVQKKFLTGKCTFAHMEIPPLLLAILCTPFLPIFGLFECSSTTQSATYPLDRSDFLIRLGTEAKCYSLLSTAKSFVGLLLMHKKVL